MGNFFLKKELDLGSLLLMLMIRVIGSIELMTGGFWRICRIYVFFLEHFI